MFRLNTLYWALVATAATATTVPASSAAASSTSSASNTCPSKYPGPGSDAHMVKSNATAWPWQTYQTSPLQPPELSITTSGAPLAPGYVFLAPSNFNTTYAVGQSGPFIMTDKGDLIWGANVPFANNFRMQTLFGKPVISYWSGKQTEGAQIGHGYGQVNILDTSYNQIYTVCPQLNLTLTPDLVGQVKCEADIHESQITSENTLLVTAYNITPADLSPIGGPKNGWVDDCLAFELDVKTGEVLFSWSALAHVPINQTHQPLMPGSGSNQSSAFDYFHINSIQKFNGKYLINSRHVWATYYVEKSGKIDWVVKGDTGGDFGALPTNGHFRWQHDARIRSMDSTGVVVSWFNNYNSQVNNGTNQTDGLQLRLPLPPKSNPPITQLHKVQDSEPVFADSQGSFNPLSNGNYIQGYGQIPIAREWGPAASGNDVAWEARFGVDNLVQSYRVFKDTWSATPTTKPSLKVNPSGNGGCAYGFVSWNGATNVTGYNVYTGSSKDQLKLLGQVPRRAFETKFDLPKDTAAKGSYCVQVGAVQGGSEIKRSDVDCQ